MKNKPNILIIHTDQQSCWTIGAYGGTLIDTPHIDSLANEGALFTNFFTPNAVCMPSRGTFLTGRYAEFHGAGQGHSALNRDEVTFAHLLKQQDYETGYLGKWHLDAGQIPGWMKSDRSMGFEDCEYMFNRGHWKEVIEQEDGPPEVSFDIGDEKTYMTDWLADKTVEFIKKPRSKPFLCMVSIPDPHSPFNVRAPYDTMYKPEDMPIPSSFYEEHPPDWALDAPAGRNRHGFPLDMENRGQKLQFLKAQYCGQVKCIDDNVGKILDSLQQQQILDHTIVVFTSDHGEYMGEHGLLYKNNIYETAYRIPLIMRWPAKIQSGTVIENMISNVDFQQTLSGILDIESSGREHGRDASGLLLDQTADWQEEAFMHRNGALSAGIFTPEYQLTYVGRGFKDHVLFDRQNDPEQTNNLFADPQYQSVIEKLTTRIVEHHNELCSSLENLPEIIQEKLKKT